MPIWETFGNSSIRGFLSSAKESPMWTTATSLNIDAGFTTSGSVAFSLTPGVTRYTSNDGITWTKRADLPTPGDYSDPKFDPTGIFIGIISNANPKVTGNSYLYTTTPTETFSSDFPGAYTGHAYGLYGHTVTQYYVSYMSGYNYIYKRDGGTYSSTYTSDGSWWTDIGSNNADTIVVVSDSNNKTRYTTTKGLPTSSGNIAHGSGSSSVLWNGTRFIVLPWSSTQYSHSTDGITWSAGTLPDGGINGTWFGGTYNGRFLIYRANGTKAWVSDDGLTWRDGGTFAEKLTYNPPTAAVHNGYWIVGRNYILNSKLN